MITAGGMEIAIAFLAGLLFGSFLNVCIYRMPRDLSVVWPGSRCIVCSHPIAWYDNVPLLSYLLLGGRCRHCRALISIRYPLVELLTGLLFAASVWRFGAGMAGGKQSLFCAILLVLIFSDLDTRILPDEFTLGGTAAGILIAWWQPPQRLWTLLIPAPAGRAWPGLLEAAASAAAGAASLWLVAELYHRIRHREGLGLGDVKMVAMMGAFLGFPQTMLAIFYACILGSVGGLAYIHLTRRDPSTYQLPFGTFLGVATLVLSFFPRSTPL